MGGNKLTFDSVMKRTRFSSNAKYRPLDDFNSGRLRGDRPPTRVKSVFICVHVCACVLYA